jgi:hypothetical protein
MPRLRGVLVDLGELLLGLFQQRDPGDGLHDIFEGSVDFCFSPKATAHAHVGRRRAAARTTAGAGR